MANLVPVGEGITAAAPPIKAEEMGQLRLAAKLVSDINSAAKSPLGLYSLCACDDQGADIIVKPFHREWNQLVLENRFVLIEASRGTTKTSFAIFFALWMIGKNPNIRIKWLGPDDRNAQKRLRTIRDYITGSKLYQATFPHIVLDKKSPNNIGSLTVVRDIKTPELTLEAKGILSAGTGDRADLIILDDICSYRNTILNASLRDQVKNKLQGDWLPTLDPRRGRVLGIFTPWHCFPQGAELLSADGSLRKVETLSPGDILHDGRLPAVVEQNTPEWFEGELVKITCTGLPREPLLVTPRHGVPTVHGLKYAEDVSVGDFLYQVAAGETELDANGLLALSTPARRKHPRNPDRHIASRVSKKQLQELLDKGLSYNQIAKQLKLSGKEYVCVLVNRVYGLQPRDCQHNACDDYILRPEFWRLAGYWLAEGSSDRSNYALDLIFSHGERGTLAADARRILQSLGIKAQRDTGRRAHRSACRVSFSARNLYHFFRDTFGSEATRKRVPPWIGRLPKDLLLEFLKGWQAGDGCIGTNGKWLRISTFSRDLAAGATRLLTSLGLPYRVYSGAVRPSSLCPNSCGARYEIRYALDPSRLRALRAGPCDANHAHRVTSVERIAYRGWVYPTKTSTGYVNTGFLYSHNSDDANAELIRTTNWVYKKYAHGLPGDPYHSIFEELFPREKLMQLRKEEGDLHYARGRLCQALTKDTVAIMAEHLRVYSARELTVDKLNRAICVYAIDPSSGKDLAKAKLDFMGNCILLFVPRLDGDPWRELSPYEIFVPECFQVKLSTREQVELIRRMSKQWRPDWVVIEAEGMQNLHEWLWEEPWINPEQVTPITSGGLSKGQRLMQVTPLLEPPEECPPIVYFHPEVVNPTPAPFELALPGGPYEALRNLRHQALNFPTQHDDTLDSAVHGMRFIKQWVIPEVIGEISLIQEHMELEARELILSRRKLDGLGPAVGPSRQPTTRWEKKAPPPATIPEGDYDPEYGWVGWAK